MSKQSFSRIKSITVIDGFVVIQVYDPGTNGLNDRYMTPAAAQLHCDNMKAQLNKIAMQDLGASAIWSELIDDMQAKIDEATLWRFKKGISPAETIPVKRVELTEKEIQQLMDSQSSMGPV